MLLIFYLLRYNKRVTLGTKIVYGSSTMFVCVKSVLGYFQNATKKTILKEEITYTILFWST